MALKNLMSMSSSELKKFLDSFDVVLCDCDGVVWNFNTPVPGVKETLLKLRKCGKQLRFVSNNCTGGLQVTYGRLKELEPEIEVDDIAYPTLAIIDYLKKLDYQKEVFVVGTSRMRQEFSTAGFTVANPGPDRIEENFGALIHELKDNQDIGAVVFDYDLNLNCVRMLKTIIYLSRPDVLYITGGTDKALPAGLLLPILGPGSFQHPIEEITGRVPLRFGKPGRHFKKYITEKFNIQNPSRTLLIGDSLSQDMEFAGIAGYQKLLVLTGITTLEKAKNCTNKESVPDFYINSLGDLHAEIKNKLNI